MRILITGGQGQLGRDLQSALASHDVSALGHRALDVTDPSACVQAIAAFRPTLVIHAAALTDTTRCEAEPALAYAVNAAGADNVGRACAKAGAAMLYVSTNEVFDGTASGPYSEDAPTNPINVYGGSKLEGERRTREALDQCYVVRSSWLYGQGGVNFVTKLLADRGASVGVTDEVATPTWTRDLAHAMSRLVETEQYGLYHLPNAGIASRYDWAREILRLAKSDASLRPATTAEFRASLPPDAVTPRKPPYSVLDNIAGAALGIELRPWEDALAQYFAIVQDEHAPR